jgi:uncharacterized membrane protein
MIPINAFDPVTLVLISLLNPAAAVTGFLMGRHADQWQKLIVAAMGAALAGFVLYWIATYVGIFRVHALGGEGGMILMQTVLGFLWACVGYFIFPAKKA